MNATSTVPVMVEGGGGQVVAHVGLHALGAFADRLGLGEELSAAVAAGGEQRRLGHDRGKVLTQVMLMLAGGGECCADIEYLRSQPGLFGPVPSDSTLHRTICAIDEATLGYLGEAMRDVRAQVWRRSSATSGTAAVVLDIDASLVEIHSEKKEGTAATYKGGYGFHPMFCFADATGEALAGLLRPGNAGANSIEDHLAVLDAAIAQLPAEVAAGHRDGDDAAGVGRPLRVRADSAGCSTRFASACRSRNIGFSVVARSNRAIHAAISVVADDDSAWAVAADQAGGDRGRSGVVEVTDLVDLSAWPTGTRLVVRREPLHPGAQTSLFPSLEYRYWGHYSDAGGSAVERDVDMRAHAHVEDHIRRLKGSGLERFPFTVLGANRAWMAVVCFAADVVRWFQLLCLTDSLALAEPKALRWSLWHTPARIVRRARQVVVRILDSWPAARELLDAYGRIDLIT
ncbi:MAG: IS1380 family transposase [Acidimicrobiales bacterium]